MEHRPKHYSFCIVNANGSKREPRRVHRASGFVQTRLAPGAAARATNYTGPPCFKKDKFWHIAGTRANRGVDVCQESGSKWDVGVLALGEVT